ncbi:MAG: hypothetical protein ACRC0L_04245 [Angustibacter sp.]
MSEPGRLATAQGYGQLLPRHHVGRPEGVEPLQADDRITRIRPGQRLLSYSPERLALLHGDVPYPKRLSLSASGADADGNEHCEQEQNDQATPKNDAASTSQAQMSLRPSPRNRIVWN